MDLEIVQSNWGANHKWCFRNCLEDIEKWLAEIGVTCHLELLQRLAYWVLHARILRKALDT